MAVGQVKEGTHPNLKLFGNFVPVGVFEHVTQEDLLHRFAVTVDLTDDTQLDDGCHHAVEGVDEPRVVALGRATVTWIHGAKQVGRASLELECRLVVHDMDMLVVAADEHHERHEDVLIDDAQLRPCVMDAAPRVVDDLDVFEITPVFPHFLPVERKEGRNPGDVRRVAEPLLFGILRFGGRCRRRVVLPRLITTITIEYTPDTHQVCQADGIPGQDAVQHGRVVLHDVLPFFGGEFQGPVLITHAPTLAATG